jgi:hypothetical protein
MPRAQAGSCPAVRGQAGAKGLKIAENRGAGRSAGIEICRQRYRSIYRFPNIRIYPMTDQVTMGGLRFRLRADRAASSPSVSP